MLTPEEVAGYRQVYGGQRHLWWVPPGVILALSDTADALREALELAERTLSEIGVHERYCVGFAPDRTGYAAWAEWHKAAIARRAAELVPEAEGGAE